MKNHYSKTRSFFGFNNSIEDDPAKFDAITNQDEACESDADSDSYDGSENNGKGQGDGD